MGGWVGGTLARPVTYKTAVIMRLPNAVRGFSTHKMAKGLHLTFYLLASVMRKQTLPAASGSGLDFRKQGLVNVALYWYVRAIRVPKTRGEMAPGGGKACPAAQSVQRERPRAGAWMMRERHHTPDDGSTLSVTPPHPHTS